MSRGRIIYARFASGVSFPRIVPVAFPNAGTEIKSFYEDKKAETERTKAETKLQKAEAKLQKEKEKTKSEEPVDGKVE